MEGLRIFVVDKNQNFKVVKNKLFGLTEKHWWQTHNSLKNIGNFIKGIKNGDIVGIAVSRKLQGNTDLSSVYTVIENELGAKRIREAGHKNAYVLIAVKGDKQSVIEDVDNSGGKTRHAAASLEYKASNRQVIVSSKIVDGDWLGTTPDFGVYQWDQVNRKIDIAEEAVGWEAGDKVLFTSTDFSMEQTEIGTVRQCDSCTAKQIRVNILPRYVHWSRLDYNIDYRGEIALLTRNIKVKGEMRDQCPPENGNCQKYNFDTFGGHIKVLKDFVDVHVEGVELENMGQQTSFGNYPLHFHLCHDMDGAKYPNPPYLRKNSIYNTFARCITIHGSHGTKILDNVCYNTLGHSVFLEDGGEKRTLLDGNLVAVTRKGSLIPGDDKPASYWLTNPQTVLRNNVAAGSEHMGFWVIFPNEPTGPSRPLGFMKKDEAKHTKFTEINNNLAHSNLIAGFFLDGMIADDLTVTEFGTNRYLPRTMPLDPKNKNAKDDPVFVDKMTCWKNRIMNMWISGGYIVVRQLSSADSSRGMEFARTTNQEQFIEDSVFLGETDNIGEPTTVWSHSQKTFLGYPRSLALPWEPKCPIQGFVYYDGPLYANRLWFSNFQGTENYTSGAIGFLRDNKHGSASVNSITDARFGFSDPSGGNRVYDGDKTVFGFNDLDGDKGASFRDIDGSTTDTSDLKTIVKPKRFYTTSACEFRTNWNMAYCPYKYAKLDVDIDWSSPDRGKTNAIMVRDDEPDHPETLTDKHTAMFNTILGGSHSYTLHWSKQIPSSFWVWGNGVEKDLFVRLGICLPVNAKFELFTWSPHWRPSLSTWKKVNSIQELDDDRVGDRYFFDAPIGMLFIKFMSFNTRTAETTKVCNGWCPVVKVTVKSGDRSNGDCRPKVYNNPGNYRRPSSGVMTTDIRILPATDSQPPATWGAGPQVPWRTVVASAKKSVSGTPGGFSEWGTWGPCIASQCHGFKERERSCNIAANGGQFCAGSTREAVPCNKCINNV